MTTTMAMRREKWELRKFNLGFNLHYYCVMLIYTCFVYSNVYTRKKKGNERISHKSRKLFATIVLCCFSSFLLFPFLFNFILVCSSAMSKDKFHLYHSHFNSIHFLLNYNVNFFNTFFFLLFKEY